MILLIENDKKELKIGMTDEDIQKTSKYKFRKIIEENITKETFEYLINKKESHSKAENLFYNKLECQKYLKSDNELNNQEKQLLFKFRTRMINLKNNLKNNFNELKCELGCDELEEQKHLFDCETLLNNCEHLANNVTIEYEDIFGDETKQRNAIKLLSHIWKTRDKLLSKKSA